MWLHVVRRCAPTRLQKRPRPFVLPCDGFLFFCADCLIELMSSQAVKLVKMSSQAVKLVKFCWAGTHLKNFIYKCAFFDQYWGPPVTIRRMHSQKYLYEDIFVRCLFTREGGRCFCLESSDLPVFPGWKCQVGPTWPAASSSLLINELSMTTRASR